MRLSKGSLEKELLGFWGAGRDSQIAARYYGFDGRGGRTLLAVGEEYGLTRERVRQIVDAVTEPLSSPPPTLPMLHRTIAVVGNQFPSAAGEIEAKQKAQRPTSTLFRLERVIKTDELIRKPRR